MQIDLFTFIAQIVNFIILVVLLYFFLFKKIIGAIDAREETIRNEFQEAELRKGEGEAEKQKYEGELRALREQKDAHKKEAQEEARIEKEAMLHSAHQEIEEKKRSWQRTLEEEKGDFLQSLEKKIGKEVLRTASQVLQDLSGADLNRQIFAKFLDVLETLSEEERKNFRSVYQKGEKKEVTLLSSFPLSEENKETLKSAINRTLGEDIQIVYKESIRTLGIALKIDSFQLRWTTRHFFAELEKEFEKTLIVHHE